MKIKLIYALILLPYWAFAQRTAKEDFKKLVNYTNCICVNLSLSESVNKNWHDTFKKKIPDCRKVENYKQIKESIDTNIILTIELSKEINKLAEKYNDKFSYDENTQLFIDSLFYFQSTLNPKIADFINKRKDYLLKHKINSYIQTQKSMEIEELKQQINKLQKKETPPNLTIPLIIVGLLAGASLVISAFRLIKIFSNTKTKNKESINNSKIEENEKTLDVNNKNLKSFDKKIDVLEEKLIKLEERQTKLEERQTKSIVPEFNTNIQNNSSSQKNIENTIQNKHTEPIKSIFYVIYPSYENDRAYFSEENLKAKFQQGAHIFKFIKTGNNTAEFEIHGDDSVFDKIKKNVQEVIKYAVFVEGEAKENFTTIHTIEPGKAKLEENKWIIVTPTKISYE